MNRPFLLLLTLMAALFPSSLRSQTYDVIIRHGRVVDGSGNPAFFADVAVKDGRIAAIGRISGESQDCNQRHRPHRRPRLYRRPHAC